MSKVKTKLMKLITNGVPTSKGAMSKRIIWFSIFFIVCYTIGVMFLQVRFGVQPNDTLTTSVFAFFGGELIMLMIKRMFSPKTTEQEEQEKV